MTVAKALASCAEASNWLDVSRSNPIDVTMDGWPADCLLPHGTCD